MSRKRRCGLRRFALTSKQAYVILFFVLKRVQENSHGLQSKDLNYKKQSKFTNQGVRGEYVKKFECL